MIGEVHQHQTNRFIVVAVERKKQSVTYIEPCPAEVGIDFSRIGLGKVTCCDGLHKLVVSGDPAGIDRMVKIDFHRRDP